MKDVTDFDLCSPVAGRLCENRAEAGEKLFFKLKKYVFLVAGLVVILLLIVWLPDRIGPELSQTALPENLCLKPLPELAVSESNGMREGVSGAFGGVTDGKIIVAGGCNFPGLPAAEGGEKVYYDRIYVLPDPGQEKSEWISAGKLPVKVAYGAAVSLPQGVVCIGGRNEAALLNSVWLLRWEEEGQRVVVKELAALPVEMDNMTAATDGECVYVAGGNVGGVPGNRAFVLKNTDAEHWEALPDFPGCARLQPVSVVAGGKYYLIGGFQPATEREECRLPLNILCYDPADSRWTEGSEAPATFVGSAAVTLNDSVCVIAGGIDAEIFKAALNNSLWQQQASLQGDDKRLAHLRREQEEYLKHVPGWYRFNRRLMVGRVAENRWMCIGEFNELARAGAVLVNYRNRLIVVNGESKPGIRSAGVYGIEFGEKDLQVDPVKN